ncbi:MAG TPA: preprotein translocase subunit SecG [Bacteroidota bacterium]|nr:preprotein translocase subunit SecG [Bacteroidota bacterium]HTY01136.1 preprotein translocase subunit SecG [Bacteroidota bacterium]
MFTFLIVLELIVSILLILVILMQSSKGGGLAGTFGGGNVGMVFGVRRTADFLIRGTQVLAALFIILALVTNIFFLPRSGNAQSVLQRGTPSHGAVTPQLPPTSEPAQGAPAQTAPPPANGR